MNDVNAFFNVDFKNVIIGVLLFLVCFQYIFKLVKWMIDTFGIEFKWKRKNDETKELVSKHDKIITELVDYNNNIRNDHELLLKHDILIEKILKGNEDILNEMKNNTNITTKISMNLNKLEIEQSLLKDSQIEFLRDRIGQRVRYYMHTLKGIPIDEVSELEDLIGVYTKIGGNHGMETQVQFCLDSLPRLTATRHVVQKDEKDTTN